MSPLVDLDVHRHVDQRMRYETRPVVKATIDLGVPMAWKERDPATNAVLAVTPVLNTAQMTNLWNLSPGDRYYVSTLNQERSIAFNHVTTNLLLASRTPSNQVVVLDEGRATDVPHGLSQVA